MRRYAAVSFALFAFFAVTMPARAGVSIYASKDLFLAAAPGIVLSATFESRPLGATSAFTEGGITFSSPLDNLEVVGASNRGVMNPIPPSHMLTGEGADDILATISAPTHALGLTLLTNRYGPGTFTLLDANNAEIIMIFADPPPAANSIGFVGFISTTPIAKVHWVAVSGELQNTGLDDFYVLPADITPAQSGSWGRIKALYR